MKAQYRTVALVAVTAAAAAAGTAAVILPVSPAEAQTTVAAGPPPPVVVGLADFTQLVDQVGPGVVNIEAIVGGRAQAAAGRGAPQQMPGMPDDEDMPEFFRRFFGPGGPGAQPGGPGGQQPAPRQGVSAGTGFIISPDGYVLTNHHVVDGADEVKVKLSDRREFTAKVIGSDEQSDVALLKITATGLPTLRIGDSRTLKPGQWVVAIGSPFGLDHSVTAGIVSAVGRSNPYANQRYVPFIQTDVAINRGNSGGPLLNTRGEVVGINSQIFSNSGGYMGVSFAIPIDVAMGAVKQLKATGKVSRGQIGVQVQAIDTEQARGLNLPDTRGALVADVLAGSPAERAGVQRGDVIRAIDGKPVDQSSDLPPVIGSMAPGTRAELSLLRDGKPRAITVTLGTLDDGAVAAATPGRPAAPTAPAANILGLTGQDLDAEDRRAAGLKPDEGVAIARVDGAAAREAGLQPGDVVLAVGRNAVGSTAGLDRALRDARVGEPVMLLVRRRGSTQYVAVTPRAPTRNQ